MSCWLRFLKREQSRCGRRCCDACGDLVWDQHSGGEGHSGREWGDGDGPLAEAFYAALPIARVRFDLMMNHPGNS